MRSRCQSCTLGERWSEIGLEVLTTLLLYGGGCETSMEQLTDDGGELLALLRRELMPHRRRVDHWAVRLRSARGGTEGRVRICFLSRTAGFPPNEPTP